MYPKNVLLRYGEALENPTERKAFLAVVTGMTGDIHGGVEQILSGQMSVALEGTTVEHLEEDLAQRWQDFFDPAEDLPSAQE